MKALQSSKLTGLVLVSGALVVAMGMSFLLSGARSLYGQVGEGNIPDMVGVWKGELYGYNFNNVADPDCRQPADIAKSQCQPQYIQNPEASFQITTQNGRVFAGLYVEGQYPRRLTGVVLPDGTVSVQGFSPTELRSFFTGTLTFTNGTYEMTGQGHSFDDFGLRAPESTKGSMASGIFRYAKVN